MLSSVGCFSHLGRRAFAHWNLSDNLSQHSPFPALKDETEVLELLVPSGRRNREEFIVTFSIAKDIALHSINVHETFLVREKITQHFTQRHDSHRCFFIFIISSWLSKYTILACYVYVKFHNKNAETEPTARHYRPCGWFIWCCMFPKSFIFIWAADKKVSESARNISYMINHYMKTNNFLVDPAMLQHFLHPLVVTFSEWRESEIE